jgi:hypothetical protein
LIGLPFDRLSGKHFPNGFWLDLRWNLEVEAEEIEIDRGNSLELVHGVVERNVNCWKRFV